MTGETEKNKQWGLIINRMKGLFNSEIMSDIKFRFGTSGEPLVYSHKVILGSASDVFKSMFYGDLKETTDVVDIPDIERPVGLEIIRFIYYGEAHLSPNNVLQVLYGARKYLLGGLEEMCKEYLHNKMDADNVCTILDVALKFDDEAMTKSCLKMIGFEPSFVFGTKSFLDISVEALGRILDEEVMEIEKEVNVLFAVIKWAEYNCKNQGLEIIGENLRKVLGEQIYKIHLLELSAEDLGKYIASNDLLDLDEIKDLLICISNNQSSDNEKFKSGERKMFEEYTCKRYNASSVPNAQESENLEAFSFMTDKDVYLSGFGLFIPERSDLEHDSLTVEVEIKDSTNKTIHDEQYKFKIDEMPGRTWKIQLKKIKILAQKNYFVKALFNGIKTYVGRCESTYVGRNDQNERLTVYCKDQNVIFKFSNHPTFSRRYLKCGRLPRLYFKTGLK